MADFALWAAACETALWPPGTRAYEANRRAAIECIIDADPFAACVREIMTERSSWTGSAADLLRAGADRSGGPKIPARSPGGYVVRRRSCGSWASTLYSVARRKQDYQDACTLEYTVRTVSTARDPGPRVRTPAAIGR